MATFSISEAIPATNATRADFYNEIKNAVPLSGLTDTTTIEVASSVLQVTKAVPRWEKFTIDHDDLQTSATTNDIEVLSLQAGGIIHGIKLKTSTAFAGTGISGYSITIGITGSLTKYASSYDCLAAVSNTNLQISSTVGAENHGSATSIRIAATSSGANLDQSTAGSIDVWVLHSAAV